ncbi:MAG: Ig-like domain-containing protein [Candidatus Zixiibacteriota bacterium]
MRRLSAVFIMSIASVLSIAGGAVAYNAVWVESKTVAPGATGVTIGVWVVNDTALTGWVLPLEFRDTDGNGSYIEGPAASFSGTQVPSTNRVGASPLTASSVMTKYGSPTTQSCSGPTSHTWPPPAAVDFLSPDAVMLALFSMSAPPNLYYLPPGNDSVAGQFEDWPSVGESTPYLAGASVTLGFNVNSSLGTFEIDTACITPNNHLMATTPPSADLVHFVFRKGIITISDVPNAAPVLAAIGSQSVTVGDSLDLTVSATDANGTPPFLMARNLPANSEFPDYADSSGTFSFHPDSSQVGVHNVTFIAWDGELADSEVVPITVSHLNLAPIIASITPKSVDEGQTLNFPVTASDPNGDTMNLTAQNVPLNASFVDNGNGIGAFSFSPDLTQSGDYDVRFVASDGLLADTEIAVITVNDVAAIRSLETGGSVPTEYALEQNYPNPFNAGTVVRFSLPRDGSVRLEIFDILGRRVRALVDESMTLGSYAVDWNGADDGGAPVASGVYFYRLEASGYSRVRSMLVLR